MGQAALLVVSSSTEGSPAKAAERLSPNDKKGSFRFCAGFSQVYSYNYMHTVGETLTLSFFVHDFDFLA